LCLRVDPDKPLIDWIDVKQGNFALVHFLTSEYRPPRNPGTDFYVEYALEDNAGKHIMCVFCVTVWLYYINLYSP